VIEKESTMGKHSDLYERHKAVLPGWSPLYYEQPIAIVEGDGRHVTDAEGNRYLDFFGGILVTMSGYNVPEVVDAIKAQADRMLHTSTLYLIESQIELAEKVAELSGIPDAKVFFTNSGTEANDTALALATTYRQSNQVLAVRGSYHGKSHSATAITGQSAWSGSSFSPFQVTYVHGGYKLRSPFGHLPDDEFIEACVNDLRDLLNVATAGDVAAMIVEPIQGVGGFVTPPDGFFGAMKEVLDEHGILFISDEVQTGWGRTGEHFWGYQAHEITPDLLTFAKGIGNGLSIGGVVTTAEIMESYPAIGISTFGGNPLATAGALANIDYVLNNDLQTNSLKVGNRLMQDLVPLAEELDVIGEVRGKGLMIGIELVGPDGKPAPDKAAAALEASREQGLLVGKGGLYGNGLRIAPPLSITEEEADEGYEVLERVLRSL
jgi:4-aminobutyrate aminotransferase